MYTHKRTVIGVAAAALLAACATPSMGPQPSPQGLNLGRARYGGRNQSMGHQHSTKRCGAAAGQRLGAAGRGGVRSEVRSVPRRNGEGKPVVALVGGQGTLASDNATRTVGSYWPYATTLFDYVRRAMPTNAPKSLTDSEVYAVSAYVLQLNGIIPQDAVMNAQTLPQVKMPNKDGFIDYSGK